MRSEIDTLGNSTRNELESRLAHVHRSLGAAQQALEGAERRLEEMRGEECLAGDGRSRERRLVALEERFETVQAGLAAAESLLGGSQERLERAWGEAAAAEHERGGALESRIQGLQTTQLELHQRLDEMMRGLTERIRTGQAAWGAHLTQTHEQLARALADDLRRALRSEAAAMATMDEELLLSDLRVEERLQEIAEQQGSAQRDPPRGEGRPSGGQEALAYSGPGSSAGQEGLWPPAVLELKSPQLRPAPAAVPAREPKHRGYADGLRSRSFPRPRAAQASQRPERRSAGPRMGPGALPGAARSCSAGSGPMRQDPGFGYASAASSPGQYVSVSPAPSPEPASPGGLELKGPGGAAAALRKWLGAGGGFGGAAAR